MLFAEETLFQAKMETKALNGVWYKNEVCNVMFPSYPKIGSKWFAYRDTGSRYIFEKVKNVLVDDLWVEMITTKGNVYRIYEIEN